MWNPRVGVPDGESSGGNTRWEILGSETPDGEYPMGYTRVGNARLGIPGGERPMGNTRVGNARWGILGWETPGGKAPGCISLVFPLELPLYGSYFPLDARGKTHFFQAEFPLSIFQMQSEVSIWST